MSKPVATLPSAEPAPRAADAPGGDVPIIAELVTESQDVAVLASSPPASRLVRFWRGLTTALEWTFGAVSLILALAVVATIPVLQVLSLGYLLEVSGRVARTGRLREGFIGVRPAARAGSIALGIWLWSWPLRFSSSMWTEARLIAPDSGPARGWHMALIVLSTLIVLHVIGACLRGGRLRSFVWPRPILLVRQLFRRGAYAEVRDTVWDFVIQMRLPYFFWLGLRGLAGAVIWLIVPVSMLAVASRMQPGLGVLTGFIGGALLALVCAHLPFLQARFAAENRLGAMFSLRENRRAFARAPWAFAIALLFTLLLALPLYLLKIEIIPREAAWLPSLLFVMSIFPARLLAGWACARANRRQEKRHWFWRLTGRLGMLPVLASYVVIVYFTQYLSWYGVWSLYEQHAFLLPVPFLGM